MRIGESNIKLWSNSEKSSQTEELTKQRQSQTQDPLTDRPSIGQQQELTQTYNARFLAKKQLQSMNYSEVTSADKSQLTKISSEHSIKEIISGLINKEVSLFDTKFLLSEELGSSFTDNRTLVQQSAEQLTMAEGETDDQGANDPALMAGTMNIGFESYRLHKEQESMQVRAMGTITLEDGRSIDFAMELEMERQFELEENLAVNLTERTLKDPLVINLTGAPVELTESSFSFDIDSDGKDDEISFVRPGSGLLVLDANEDGVINNGSELFGAQTGQGFSELAQYDADGNLWIDENDEVFNKLQVWTKDADGNDSLINLKDAGVGAIYLGSTSSEFDLTDSENNLLGKVQRSGIFLKESGEVSSVQQIDLAIHNEKEPGELEQMYDNMADKFQGFNLITPELLIGQTITIDPANIIDLTTGESLSIVNLQELSLSVDLVLGSFNRQPVDSTVELDPTPKDFFTTIAGQQTSQRSSTSSSETTSLTKETSSQAAVSPSQTSHNQPPLSYSSQDALDRLGELSQRLDSYTTDHEVKLSRLNSLLDSLKENREKLAQHRSFHSSFYF